MFSQWVKTSDNSLLSFSDQFSFGENLDDEPQCQWCEI
jgi:hypothetical protein